MNNLRGRPELIEARREEAIAFFQVNQAGRTAVERIVALFFSVAAIAASVGVAAGTPDVILPLPALLLLLLSYMFLQYADLTVLGTARRHLEDLVNEQLNSEGLIYETAVAQIRQIDPLVRSVRLLQTLLGLVVVGATVVACVVAFGDHSTLVKVSFLLGTLLAGLSALYSFIHMHQSSKVTDTMMARQGLNNRILVWVSTDLHREALEASRSDELAGETIERLIRDGLNTTGR